MRLFILLMGLPLLLLGCTSSSTLPVSPEQRAVAKIIDTIAIDSLIPYALDNEIETNIKRECRLPEKLSDFVATYAQRYNINVMRKPSIASSDSGKVLKIVIVHAVSSRSAVTVPGIGGQGGHDKSTEIEGHLYEDGKLIGSFAGKRSSQGGAFSNFKGSCAVLGRTVKALGKDVARWLRRPELDSVIGER